MTRLACWALVGIAVVCQAAAEESHTGAGDDYFPPPESAGGWRTLKDREDVRRVAGMDPSKLDVLKEWLLKSDNRDFAAVVIRHGHIVLEVERGNSAKTDARRVASVSKAVCATVLGIAAERSRQGLTPRKMTFDDRAFDFIPQAQPLSDPRKVTITVKQLLNHTSGITPEATGARNRGPWQHVLGHDGDPLTARLAFDPGTKCGYSSFALYHASLVCENVTGRPYDEFAVEALFKSIGVERWTFEYFDGGGPDGDTRYGRHPSHGLGMPARDLARIAYCMLRGGRWQDKQVVPKWFVDETAAPTHNVKEPELRFNRAAESFSHGWELPARLTGGQGDGIPQDARFKPGSGGQLIAFVPSLDLVITRQTGSSGNWEYEQYLRLACDAVVKPQVPDKLCRVTLNQEELGGELGRRITNLIYRNYMAVDLDGKWLDHFRHRTDRGDRSHVYYGIGKVIDAGSLFTAYTGDPKVALRTQYLVDELVKSRDADGYLGFWNVEPENRQDHINWILHEQEYINLAFVRNYRCTGNPQSLANARIMGDYILKTFPTPQNPCYDAGLICTAGLPEGMLELYRATGDKRYLDFAADVPHGNNRGEIQLASLRTWEHDFSRRPCHVYVMLARCYAQTELYRLTGEKSLLNMSRFMRNELLKKGEGGMLVTGSCSEGEHFTYNQNGRGAIGESCVTAYVLRWIDSLMRLEGDMRYGDLLERTVYNALLAANSPDGRWIRYFTPFTGDRKYDTRDYFCCCGNYRRAVAELPQKVYYRTAEGGIVLNLFTNSKKTFDVKGQTVTIVQETAYPNDGDVRLTFSMQDPVAFPFQFRTPRWCEKITVRMNDEAAATIDPLKQELGCYLLNRTWNDGDVVRISMPMAWRLLRGRAVQDGRVVLLRGPIVYCIGKDQNAELLAKCPEPRNLVIDPASLAEPVRDDSIRPGGLKVVAKAWLNPDCSGEKVDVALTEFIDPSGQDVYFRVPDLASTAAVRLADDEIVSWPNEFVNAHVLKAFYGPKATGDLEAIFEIRGDIVADLAADYVNPGGKTGVPAEFPDATGGQWAFYNCKNGGLLSTTAAGDVKRLGSQFKAFGTPPGYAYGLENQGDQLGFVSDYRPSDRQEEAWRNHYTEKMFDQMLSAAEREKFLYTHPISDTACYNVFRWTPSAGLKLKDITLCGTLFSNLGNGVELRVIRWNDAAQHDVIGTLNTSDATVGKCGTAEFVLRLPPGEVGEHVDFVLHNAGSHTCDATALRIRAYTNVQRVPAQTDVTEKVQARFHNRLVTPLGPYAELFGDAAHGKEKTLKVKLHYWRDGVVRYIELAQDSALDLTGK